MQIGVEIGRAVENKRIFVVMEDDIDRTVLQFMLHDENETHELASLDAAYEKAAELAPDLVLLALAIAAERGGEVLKEIKDKLPKAAIMLIAEAGQESDALPYLAKGAAGVLTKPFTVEGVRKKVDAVLGRAVDGLVQLQLTPPPPSQ